jgi:hypothetical protein
MGLSYDNAYAYDWDGTYDDGPLVPIVPPAFGNPLRLPFAAGLPRHAAERMRFTMAAAKESALRIRMAAGDSRSAALRAHWAAVAAKQERMRIAFQAAAAREAPTRVAWAGTSPRAALTRLALDQAAHTFSAHTRAHWAGTAGKSAATALAWAVALARSTGKRMPWAAAAARNATVRVRWRPGYPFTSGYTIPFGGDPDPPPGSTIVIPPAEVYFMIPALSILRTSDSADLNAIDASLRLDMNSYAWTLDATIPYATLPLVNPNSRTSPEAVTVTINGYTWSFIVEGFTDNRKFGGTGCKIRGRSLSAQLGAPYAPLVTFSNPLAKDASQLADDLMPTGWSLTWSTQDWLIPANMFTYADLAPIDALAQLVNAVGATILPDALNQELTVQPLYPTSPWHWDTATPYADVPASFVAELAGQWQGNFKTSYNGVVVSGQNSGVVGKVKLTGTAGDVQLPPITDALLCVVAANVERGRIALGKADARKSETIRTPLLPPGGSGNPGVFPVGALLQVTEPDVTSSAGTISGSTWRAQIMSVQIDAAKGSNAGAALSVRQTLSVERHS